MRVAVLAAAMSFGMTAAGAAASPPELSLLPMPASVIRQPGAFSFGAERIAASDPGERAAARRLRSLVARGGGPSLQFAQNGRIRFRRDRNVGGAEGYRLSVAPAGIEITASSDAGLYYGAETLSQLIAGSRGEKRIPALRVEDQPAFSWRGVMLDSARHFQPAAYVKELIDRMAMAKLNTLHWHLTDDQGWRVKIDRYPRLTSIGAWRQEAGAAGIDPRTGKPLVYGGYYSKAEIRSVVAFARSRHVTIVPEIEMPGHATAMIAAYPELASINRPPRVPSNDWGILPNLLVPSDSTFEFLDHVLDEVNELFPGPFIHVGGDEAVKDQWKSNPVAQERIKTLGLKDEDALQGWFTARIGNHLERRGKRTIGWDEIMLGHIPGDAAVMSWHGMDGAIAAAAAGHDTVLAPAPILYVDNRQSDSGDEPPGRGEIVSWKRLYEFDPSPSSLTPEQRRHILGLQVNLWTEHVRTTDYADRMMWPRAAILAEIAWSDGTRDWPAFSRRLAGAMAQWSKLGLGFDAVPLSPQPTFTSAPNGITVALRQPAETGTLRYALNGAKLSARSPVYTGPLTLRPGARLSAAAFLGATALGPSRTWNIEASLGRTRAASDMDLCGNAIPLRLEDDGQTAGVRKVHWVDIMHPCWIWRGAPLSGARRIVAEVGRLPFNFSIGEDINKISFARPATAAGELQVRRDGCKGPVIALVPLEGATATTGVAEVSGPLVPEAGFHDLCMTFIQKGVDPFWVLDRLSLQP
jgi:hexosaminidase